MEIKRLFARSLYVFSFACSSIVFSGCTAYLDREVDAIVSSDDAFKNFFNFQGYIEEMYNAIPDKQKAGGGTADHNFGEDEIQNVSWGDSKITNQFDLGNFRQWLNDNQTWLYNSKSDPTRLDGHNKVRLQALWQNAWYCIRKANLGLENLDKLVDATQEERDLIEGQLYFFRAWWHEEMIQWVGGLPYVDRTFGPSEELKLPRLSYQECADRCAADFRRAADLLPINWDDTEVGKNTLGKNDLRINKIMALGYLGRVYLWAASPLMEHGAQLGGTKTYDYNKDYAKKAAEAFGELLTLVESGQTQYALAEFKYDNIYDHEKSKSAANCYTDVFYTLKQNWKMPGTTEAIFRGLLSSNNTSLWGFVTQYGPKMNGLGVRGNNIKMPTANYVNYYGMANGLPLDDPNSGFDKEHPFKGRDPRFYHDFMFDGFKYLNKNLTKDNPDYDFTYCTLSTNGKMRDVVLGSRTGYFIHKLVPHTANKHDLAYTDAQAFQTHASYMRLADIYLMYAEAGAAISGASYKASNFSKTAEEVINVIRDRCGAGHVAASYVSDPHKFMDEVRRERAVELSFEGFRFNDLQRWLLLTEYPYNIKTSQEFDRLEDDDFFENNDPRNARVANWREEVILKRVYGVKHYWLPLPNDDVYLYPEFPQNPGW
ncbi:RagB/SusD family nutrient uptake outer membrane protein [uncultured Mediterranea sp.]|uniref:RagB/SusD family nutrient uptake outer membrane protein n=1 Tax=uncultured Mediterranea sp. TaxID=1926662 RepID=UPI0027D9B726|nr:RagB/SusD family nutrient uptake outer membrane protein [uncultured Mediterranea sp.]